MIHFKLDGQGGALRMALLFFAMALLAACGEDLPSAATALQNAEEPSLRGAPLNPQLAKVLAAKVGRKVLAAQAADGHALGEIPEPLDLSHNKSLPIRYPMQFDRLASSYDLRTLGRLTAVRNQGTCGACWTFGTYAALESYLISEASWDFSENNMKNTHGFDNEHCDGGNSFMAAAYLARFSGPVLESDDAYSVSSNSSPSGLTIRKHLQQVLMLPDRTSATDNDAIKNAVITYGAVKTSVYWEDASYSPTYKSYRYTGSSTATNHAVAIVGWDDNFPASRFLTAPAGDGAFIVRNSWGTSWGESGYFYLSYYDKFAVSTTVFAQAEATTNYARQYAYDPLGWSSSRGYNATDKTTAWGANIFTAVANERLGAVSSYFASNGSTYEVYVYDNPPAGSPRGGTLLGSTSGTVSIAGYHTISLAAQNILLQSGHTFSVVIHYVTPAFTYPVPVEAPTAGYSSAAAASAGQSYISYYGTSFTDLTSSLANGNVCIKAFTLPLCDDGNPCTDDSWNGSACIHPGNTLPCDDSNSCTYNDTCSGGSCVGISYSCGSHGTCSGNGVCSCNTGWAGSTCNTCAAGYYGASCTACPSCGHGTCNDGASGSGTCSCNTGWAGSSCNTCAAGYYGASCTACPSCGHGTCNDGASGSGTCYCNTGWAGATCTTTTCGDGILVGEEQCEKVDGAWPPCCDPIQCRFKSAIAICRAAVNACDKEETCSGSAAACPQDARQPDGTSCNDGNLCTQSDSCQAGVCTGANPVVCMAVDQCHEAGSCAPSTGLCTNPAKADGASCNADSNGCTVGDVCAGGFCAAGASADCSSQNDACNDGMCSSTGNASYECVKNSLAKEGLVCDADENGCTADTCLSGHCASGLPEDCAAIGDACNVGACSPTGAFSYECVKDPTPLENSPCNDDKLCTVNDVCKAGACVGVPNTCDDGVACTSDSCMPESGLCEHVPEANACNDDNPCTQDACVQAEGCAFTPLADWQACKDATHACFAGECEALASNDTCETALSIRVGDTIDASFAATHAYRAIPDSCVLPAATLTGRDAFYRITLDSQVTYAVTLTPQTPKPLALAVWSDCGNEAAACRVAVANGDGAEAAKLFFTPEAGGEYLVQVMDRGGATTDLAYTLTVLAVTTEDGDAEIEREADLADGDSETESFEEESEGERDQEPDTEQESERDTERDTEHEADSDAEQESEADTETDVIAEDEAESAADGDGEAIPEEDADRDGHVDADTDAEKEAELESADRTDGADTDTDLVADGDSDVIADGDSDGMRPGSGGGGCRSGSGSAAPLLVFAAVLALFLRRRRRA